jgi:photosystem II stability/assembly factor-like uncharacterized protein
MTNFFKKRSARHLRCLALLIFIFCLTSTHTNAQRNKKKNNDSGDKKEEKLSLSGLKFRSVGPALTSGRIADFAVNPDNPYEYYIATASGGVWKTTNSGTTFSPIFDEESSYSIGCITMDPNNSNIIWVGTGENNNQRSVAYGDGIYKSMDGGSSWKNMGLKNSEHIGKIIVHPTNSNIVWVAAIGPLWNSGGDRGVYKTVDGGETWNAVLTIDERTGVTDLIIDPRNPDILYAAAFQRARHVFTYLGGGPGSTIYKTSDGGDNWEKAHKGLPEVDLGRIGLAISPADPEIIYAIVEAAQGKSGFYRSTDRGASWHKQGDYSTSGNYYQEIVADPVDANTIFGMDTWLNVTYDGGKSFDRAGEVTKHVDNHCMWINPKNNKHWLVGCDGGIYETFDAAATWDFKPNLPVTQFYKVSVDNDQPFYHIYGGTQDNFSLGGPSRTTTSHGIINSDWFITHGGDGFETQIDPKNPNIVYAQSQYGVLVRYDRLSGEEVGIQPTARKGENAYRWNWDAPLVASPHSDGRIYFAANKVFRSDDYGNSWEVISEDLTRQLNRNELQIMGRTWSHEAVAKNRSTSPYGTIVAFAESTINSDLLIAGTDDGLIHISENSGESWRKIDGVAGAPNRSYVNAVYTSHHDENVVYVAFNHHKYGDFKPYIFKSSDKGFTWNKISNNLPERGSVYAIEEDHIDATLLFCGTEFGVFYSSNGGEKWTQLKAGVPTIAVRDIAIQRREDDLVLGTFGRGFYVLDDYSSLRSIRENSESQLLAVRDALLFEKSQPLGLPGKAMQGDSYYAGENLSSVALITYFIKDDKKTLEEIRREKEKELSKTKANVKYPSYQELRKEVDQEKAYLVFTISDQSGKVVRKFTKDVKKGLHRFEWDLRYGYKAPVDLSKPKHYNPWSGIREGSLVNPGTYDVAMQLFSDSSFMAIGAPVSFEVKPLNNTVLPAENRAEKVVFQRQVNDLSRKIQGANKLLGELSDKMKYIDEAIKIVEQPLPDLANQSRTISSKIKTLRRQLNGDSEKTTLDIDQIPSPSGRIGMIMYEQKYSTSTPTQTHRDSYRIAKEEFEDLIDAIRSLAKKDVPALEKLLEEADAPYTPGRGLLMME